MTFNSLQANAEGYNYENLMHRAYQSSSTRNPGAHHAEFENLIRAEYGKSPVKYLPSFEKQLEKIKKYLDTAFDKFLKMPKLADKHDEIKIQKDITIEANSSDILIEVIKNTIELTDSAKAYY
jgi:hypothetical protein